MATELTPFRWQGELDGGGGVDQFLDDSTEALKAADSGLDVDVRGLSPLPSRLIGALLTLGLEAQGMGKKVRVTADGSGVKSLQAVGLNQFMEIIGE